MSVHLFFANPVCNKIWFSQSFALCISFGGYFTVPRLYCKTEISIKTLKYREKIYRTAITLCEEIQNLNSAFRKTYRD